MSKVTVQVQGKANSYQVTISAEGKSPGVLIQQVDAVAKQKNWASQSSNSLPQGTERTYTFTTLQAATACSKEIEKAFIPEKRLEALLAQIVATGTWTDVATLKEMCKEGIYSGEDEKLIHTELQRLKHGGMSSDDWWQLNAALLGGYDDACQKEAIEYLKMSAQQRKKSDPLDDDRSYQMQSVQISWEAALQFLDRGKGNYTIKVRQDTPEQDFLEDLTRVDPRLAKEGTTGRPCSSFDTLSILLQFLDRCHDSPALWDRLINTATLEQIAKIRQKIQEDAVGPLFRHSTLRGHLTQLEQEILASHPTVSPKKPSAEQTKRAVGTSWDYLISSIARKNPDISLNIQSTLTAALENVEEGLSGLVFTQGKPFNPLEAMGFLLASCRRNNDRWQSLVHTVSLDEVAKIEQALKSRSSLFSERLIDLEILKQLNQEIYVRIALDVSKKIDPIA